jgi:hypothetical protein
LHPDYYDANVVEGITQMSFDIEAVQIVCEKLDSYIETIDSNEDYDFIGDLDNPNQTLMGLMIARGYLRKEIEISSLTVPILLESESVLNPIIRSLKGSENV